MDTLFAITHEAWQFLLVSSPYMLAGLLASALIRSFLSPTLIAKYLGAQSLKSVLYAALFGVPLPLCSCGVIPTAIALRRQGASRGAVLTFLITTPESGIDSIAMTYALIDPIMAFARPIVAFISGILAGSLDVLLRHHNEEPPTAEPHCPKCVDQPMDHSVPHGLMHRLKEGFQFGFVTLLNDIGGWFLLGVLIAGVIGALAPEDIISQYLGGGIVSMLIALLAAIPVYVCAAGSTPVAAALILKGMSPGAALVFLITGPATNVASLLMVQRFLGTRTTVLYVGVIAVVAIGSGFILNAVYTTMGITPQAAHHMMHHDMNSIWSLPSAILLLLGIGIAKILSRRHR